jgi:hypothetical protein
MYCFRNGITKKTRAKLLNLKVLLLVLLLFIVIYLQFSTIGVKPHLRLRDSGPTPVPGFRRGYGGFGRRARFSSSHLGDELIFIAVFHSNYVCLLFELDLVMRRTLPTNTFQYQSTNPPSHENALTIKGGWVC